MRKFYTKTVEGKAQEYFTLDDGKGCIYDGPATDEQKIEYANEYAAYKAPPLKLVKKKGAAEEGDEDPSGKAINPEKDPLPTSGKSPEGKKK